MILLEGLINTTSLLYKIMKTLFFIFNDISFLYVSFLVLWNTIHSFEREWNRFPFSPVFIRVFSLLPPKPKIIFSSELEGQRCIRDFPKVIKANVNATDKTEIWTRLDISISVSVTLSKNHSKLQHILSHHKNIKKSSNNTSL